MKEGGCGEPHPVARVQGRVDLLRLTRVSPLAAPMLLLMGRVPVEGAGRDRLVAEAADRLMREAGLG